MMSHSIHPRRLSPRRRMHRTLNRDLGWSNFNPAAADVAGLSLKLGGTDAARAPDYRFGNPNAAAPPPASASLQRR